MKKPRCYSLVLVFLIGLLSFFSVIATSADKESSYKLPYPAGEERIVVQGNFGQKSHNPDVDNGKAIYAFDFGLRDGDQVVASRAGKVLSIQDGFDKGSCNPGLANDVNYVLINHGDGTSALYLHLKKDSITVKEEQEVLQGQIITQADASGYVCGRTGEHLHFQVEETPKRIWYDSSKGYKKGWYTQSIKISFSDKDVLAKEPDGIPKEGKSYISDNEAPQESQIQRSYLCDFSQPILLRETTKYGIFGDDSFETIVCGYLKLKEVTGLPWQQTNAYFVIVDFLHEGFIKSIEEGIQIGNTVNIKENSSYWFNLGCFREAGIIGGAEIDPQTRKAILDSSPEKLISIIISFEEHPGMGCNCCNLAKRISSYPPLPTTPFVDAEKAKENALSQFVEKNDRGDVLIVRKPEYHIIYFAKEDQFLLSILKSPFEEWRKTAEEEFLKITQAEKYILCQLNIVITTPYFANPELAGKNFPLSFCE